MDVQQELVSQAEFARRMEVSRAAVSQWKKKDILRDDAFSLPGKKGKVRLQIAADQVQRNRDVGQSLGNGLDTGVGVTNPVAQIASGEAQPDPSVQPVEPLPTNPNVSSPGDIKRVDQVQDMHKRAKLEEQLRKNRKAAAEEALRVGILMSSDDVQEQMGRVAVMMMQIFEGSLTDFATALAEKFAIPHRDALHLLKAEFRKVRETAAKKERARAEAVQKEITVSVDA